MALAKVCFECKEYVVIHDNFMSQMRERAFEKDHHHHPLAIMDVAEVTKYHNANSRYTSRPMAYH